MSDIPKTYAQFCQDYGEILWMMHQQITRLEKECDQLRAENEELRKCCTQRSARMQIMREMFREIDWHHACMERPEMRDWFDDNGVPVDG